MKKSRFISAFLLSMIGISCYGVFEVLEPLPNLNIYLNRAFPPLEITYKQTKGPKLSMGKLGTWSHGSNEIDIRNVKWWRQHIYGVNIFAVRRHLGIKKGKTYEFAITIKSKPTGRIYETQLRLVGTTIGSDVYLKPVGTSDFIKINIDYFRKSKMLSGKGLHYRVITNMLNQLFAIIIEP